MTPDKLVERIARALWDADIKADSLLRSTLTAALSEARPQDAAEIYRDRARAAIAALDSAGLCIVPREPTEGMRMAPWREDICATRDEGRIGRDTAGHVYRAMIAAAGEG